MYAMRISAATSPGKMIEASVLLFQAGSEPPPTSTAQYEAPTAKPAASTKAIRFTQI